MEFNSVFKGLNKYGILQKSHQHRISYDRATVNNGTWNDTEGFIVARLKLKYFCHKVFITTISMFYCPLLFFYIN